MRLTELRILNSIFLSCDEISLQLLEVYMSPNDCQVGRFQMSQNLQHLNFSTLENKFTSILYNYSDVLMIFFVNLEVLR